MSKASLPRPEYPRPQLQRENDTWLNLNGEWEFEFDDARLGDREQWYREHAFSRRIQVPYCFQSKLSGIEDTGFHEQVWYRRQVTLPEGMAGKRLILRFGAVDYQAWVWVNGQMAAFHEGGHTPFAVEITDLIREGSNEIVVKARDFDEDVTLPRGKQYWKEKSESIWYTRTTGIWQTVWLEAVPEVYLQKIKYTPDIDTNEIRIRAMVDGDLNGREVVLKTTVTFQGEPVAEHTARLLRPETSFRIGLHDFNDHSMGRWWSPRNPRLYDVRYRLLVDGVETDLAESYFGMRKISIEDGKICLNNYPYKMKLVLDQGYFPEGLLTPPSDEAIRQDVELTKAMGFNGARKHQKIEDPRYLYWCDKLGLLVWGEMANSQAYSEEYVSRMTREWQEAIERDYNHPCIVAWVPLNESWGVNQILVNRKQQQHALTMYHLTKSLDDTRLVISNDGWEHVKSDICTIHDYESRREVLTERYSTAEKAVTGKPASRWIHVPGFAYGGEPIHISEYGGISFKKSDWEGWGYSAAKDDKDFIERYMAVTQPLLQSPIVQGFCYTQLTDVEQEINGLLTYDRKPKVPLEIIRQINEGKQPEGY
ncbi:glycoside hydrolase family 2 TIM barrel-domain containing protein [Paenibacillus aurantius]|uniref:Glycoside hydrolase family 2 TIM barrel-domain containing protein n=1 Tax=Paenibacillus aurantius TaxID=2918900 RepID=A0AA96LAG5_9BACL|nr:sugar-binding domain-containing protein [Paenibacillus aurantius]WNQ10041.1 glycoside hydrolase family 2 TIM barrel-domain containing protein [Paenibacillus aurantius]